MLEHFQTKASYLPIDLLNISNFLLAIGVVTFFIIFRYFLLVGLTYYFFWKTTFFKNWSLYKKQPGKKQILFEIKYSLISSLIFAFSGVLIGVFWQLGWSKIYLDFSRYGYFYLFFSLVVYALIHEFYFYITHRWMHHPKVFKRVHAIHHRSVKTSPWASFSFHPIEALIEAAILPLLILIVPIHPVVFITYLLVMTVSAVVNHLGYEVLRGPFSYFSKFLISGTHHSLHHKEFNSNYGLYFTFMDKLFKTESKSSYVARNDLDNIINSPIYVLEKEI